MQSRFHQWIVGLSIVFLSTNSILGQVELKPPFGLRWGDSPEKLLFWATQKRLNVTVTIFGRQPNLKILRIQSEHGFLPETQVSAVEARFVGGSLCEVTTHYFDSNASSEEMKERFELLRQHIQKNYGPLLPSQQQRTVTDQFITRTKSYSYQTLKDSVLSITYTDNEDSLRKATVSRFSLTYQSTLHENR